VCDIIIEKGVMEVVAMIKKYGDAKHVCTLLHLY
jgi:hypothetical protein